MDNIAVYFQKNIEEVYLVEIKVIGRGTIG